MPERKKESDKNMSVIVMGPPGAGKTTQSEWLAKELGLVHIITSELIRSALYDPEHQDDPMIISERKTFESGGINTPEWVTKMTLAKTEEVASANRGVIFSASPRTVYEAEAMMPVLKRLYPKLFIFFLHLKFEEARKRIGARRVCSGCGVPVLPQEKQQNCLKCGGEIILRALDGEDKLRHRFDQYQSRTEPIIGFFKKNDYPYADLDGSCPVGVMRANLFSQIMMKY